MEDAQKLLALPCYRIREKYRVIKQLSKGSYGDVFLAERIEGGIRVCLKRVDLDFLSPNERFGCLSEVQLLQSLPPHPNVVSCFDAFWDDTSDVGGGARLVLVLEYGDAGDLESFVQTAILQRQGVDVDIALDIFVQILSGLSFLHQLRILHRDIKSKNVFRFSNGRVVIGDFGTSKSLAHTAALAHTLVGSPLYMSPELFEDRPYSFSSDIWSLGCLLYELFAGKTPFTAPSYPAVVFRITKGTFDPLPTTAPEEIQTLVTQMLSLDPSKRPTVEDILEMQIVRSRGSRPTTVTPCEPAVLPVVCNASDPPTEPVEATDAIGVHPEVISVSDVPQGPPTLLPPPPPVSIGAISTTTTGVGQLPPSPQPETKPLHVARRTHAAPVFPTTRASIANILSRERVNVHKEGTRQAIADRGEPRFLSCVPVMDTGVTATQSKKTNSRVPTPVAGPTVNRRQHVPPENMLIIGSKVKSIQSTTKSASARR